MQVDYGAAQPAPGTMPKITAPDNNLTQLRASPIRASTRYNPPRLTSSPKP